MSVAPTQPGVDPRRALRAHLLATRLMGVDFIPVGEAPEIESVKSEPFALYQRDVGEPALTGGPQARAEEPPVAPKSRVSAPAAAVGEAPAAPKSKAFVPARAEPLVEPKRSAPAQLFIPTPGLTDDPHGVAQAPPHSEIKPLPRLDRPSAEAWLDRLRIRYDADAPHKAFCTSFNCIVFGEGNPEARLMFIGEAPGAEEDKTGRPFVGRAGQLLDRMITGIGLAREDVYIANVLKTRPPNNATPTFEEAAACAPYLFEQIAIIRPEVIVTLGLPATRLLLNTSASMSSLRGRWSTFVIPRKLPHADAYPDVEPAPPAVPVMPTFHPAFLLRSYTKENRAKVWSDLLMVVDRLGLPRPKASAAQA